MYRGCAQCGVCVQAAVRALSSRRRVAAAVTALQLKGRALLAHRRDVRRRTLHGLWHFTLRERTHLLAFVHLLATVYITILFGLLMLYGKRV